MKTYDIAFSLGPCCRPAYYLQLCGLRTYAYPLDWQGTTVENSLYLYQTKFKDFFLNYKDLSNKAKCLEGLRHVIDTDNGVTAMHHVRNDIPITDAIKEFRGLMLKRYKRLDNHLNAAKSILILSNHNRKINVLINFLIEFSKIYKDKKISLVNIHNRKNGKHKHIHKINDKLEVIEYFISDVNKNGANPNTNKNFWLGNEEKWIEIINDYSLVDVKK